MIQRKGNDEISLLISYRISAVNERGEVPPYVEHCTATLAAAYSSGGNHDRRIVSIF